MEFREIIFLLMRFESSVSELPANSRHAKELHPEVIEKKVLAACAIRQELRNLCDAPEPIDFDVAVTKVHIPYTRTPLIPQLFSP